MADRWILRERLLDAAGYRTPISTDSLQSRNMRHGVPAPVWAHSMGPSTVCLYKGVRHKEEHSAEILSFLENRQSKVDKGHQLYLFVPQSTTLRLRESEWRRLRHVARLVRVEDDFADRIQTEQERILEVKRRDQARAAALEKHWMRIEARPEPTPSVFAGMAPASLSEAQIVALRKQIEEDQGE